MNPYMRFSLVSNTVSAALVLGALTIYGPAGMEAATASSGGSGPALWAALAAGVGVLVVFWVTMTEAIFPSLFRFESVRKLVLGKYYMEGTWLQAERGDGVTRMSVIDIQPKGKRFTFTGYSLNEDLEIESNTRIEFSRFDWPFMVYKHRNSLSDGTDGLSEGVGEIQFEMNRSAARRYNGFLQFVRNQQRLKVEGVKLRSGREIKRLRSLEGRREIFSKYWELFFNRSIGGAAQPAAMPAEARQPCTRPLPVMEEAMAGAEPACNEPQPAERRVNDVPPTADLDGVIPRRRASDWQQGLAGETAGQPVSSSDPARFDDEMFEAEPVGEEASRTGTDGEPRSEIPRISRTGLDYRKRPLI